MRITARFDTFDEAENCARALKQNCEGIRTIRIRRKTPSATQPPIGDPPEMVVPFALYNDQTTTGIPENSVTDGAYNGVFAMNFAWDEASPGAEDGPSGREECSMEVLALSDAAADVEQGILNAHGRCIRRIQL